MTPGDTPRGTSDPRRGERIVARLIALYPRDFRERYAAAMRDFYRDRLALAEQCGERPLLLWTRIIADAIASAAAEHARPFLPGGAGMETIIQDLWYGIRGVGRRPAFAAIVVATIALGVGVNAAMFSVVDGILIRPLPYPHAERLLSFGHEAPEWLSSAPDFLDYRRDMTSLDGLAAYTRGDATIVRDGEPERVRIARPSAEFFHVLGVPAMLGRTFSIEDHRPRIAQAVVISYPLWQRSFGGDPSIVGKTIALEGAPRMVIGVMPPRFDFPEARTDLWLPMPAAALDSNTDRGLNFLFMVARLKPGITADRARADALTIARRIMHDNPGTFDPARPLVPHLTSVIDDTVGNTRPYLVALLGAVGFVLLIACANVASLLLARGEGRQKEMAVRSALGASSLRLTSQLLTESGTLAFFGGAAGLGLAWAVERALVALAPASIPRLDAIGVDWRVIVFTAFVTLITGILIGVLPARHAGRSNAADALKEAGRVVTARGARSARRVLIVAEVALAAVALTGAGMLLRSLHYLQSASLGFDERGVLTARVSISPRQYDDARARVFYEELLTKLRAAPGVRNAAMAGWLPIVDAGGLRGYQPEGVVFPSGHMPSATPQEVTAGYFAAMRIPLLAGRDFTDADDFNAPLVAIVSRKFADATWPNANALGQRFSLTNNRPVTVVGVVGDFRSRGFDDAPEPTMYFPYAQTAPVGYGQPNAMTVVLRGSEGRDPLLLAAAVRDAVRSLDRTAPVSEIRTLEQVVGTSTSNRRFNTALLVGFALLAMLLAGIGTYGVISYDVTQRSFEIGVRMALGAEDRAVLALVMSEGMRLALLGLAIGLGASMAMGRLMRALLVGISPVDAPSLAITAAVLLLVATAACAIPALRALRISPLEAVRG